MTSRTSAIEHPVRRLLIALPEPYDAAREHYETLVPEVDSARFHELESWQAVLDFGAMNAHHHFLRYAATEVTQTMALSPSRWNSTAYLMGNHTIAERMFRHDPSAMLHAPLRTLLYADTKLAVDQPSLQFTSYGNPDIAAVGENSTGCSPHWSNCSAATFPTNYAEPPPNRQRASCIRVSECRGLTTDTRLNG